MFRRLLRQNVPDKAVSVFFMKLVGLLNSILVGILESFPILRSDFLTNRIEMRLSETGEVLVELGT